VAESRQLPEEEDAVLARLARLSAALAVDPAPDELAAVVRDRIRTLPVPAPRSPMSEGVARLTDRLRRHWRVATAVAVALLLGLLAVSSAGARIAQWLGIGGIQIVQESAPPEGDARGGQPDPASADGFREIGLDQARTLVSFPLGLPGELGPPTRVLIGPGDAVVSMVWADGDPTNPDGPIRLDQLAGTPDPAVIKKYFADVEFAELGGHDAYWLRAPHPLVYTDSSGAEHTERSRIAGPTLIRQDGPVTLRLEGVGTEQRALQIARTLG